MNRPSATWGAESAILLRMAASRAELLVANSTSPSVPAVHGLAQSPAAGLVNSLARAPRVTLLLALGVGAVVLGPRRTLAIVSRSGIAAWLGGTVRKALLEPV